jgi:hypothetical protein
MRYCTSKLEQLEQVRRCGGYDTFVSMFIVVSYALTNSHVMNVLVLYFTSRIQ